MFRHGVIKELQETGTGTSTAAATHATAATGSPLHVFGLAPTPAHYAIDARAPAPEKVVEPPNAKILRTLKTIGDFVKSNGEGFRFKAGRAWHYSVIAKCRGVKMARHHNRDLRCVLHPAPAGVWVQNTCRIQNNDG